MVVVWKRRAKMAKWANRARRAGRALCSIRNPNPFARRFEGNSDADTMTSNLLKMQEVPRKCAGRG